MESFSGFNCKAYFFFLTVIVTACDNNVQKDEKNNHSDSLYNERENTVQGQDEPTVGKPSIERYSNPRFREVTVDKIRENTYEIRGEGQVFEANLNWVVEDGHHELKQGFETTAAGAPEWGAFKFEIEVQKARSHSTLTLILFEISAKDGTRQHELPIVLE